MSVTRNLSRLLNNSTGKVSINNLVSGSVIQVKNVVKTDIFATSGFTMVDVPGMSISIAPYSNSSKFLILADIYTSADYYKSFINIVRNNTVLGIGDGVGDNRYRGTSTSAGDQYVVNTHGIILPVKIMIVDSPNTSDTITYKVQASGRTNNTTFINRSVPDRTNGDFDDRLCSQLTIMEVVG